MRTFGAVLAALALPVLTPSAASASPGWDFVGHGEFSWFNAGGGIDYYYSHPIALSTGGNFRVCIATHHDVSMIYNLYEYDPGNNEDERVGYYWRDSKGCITAKGIGQFVDSKNNRAEFYIRTDDSRADGVKYYD